MYVELVGFIFILCTWNFITNYYSLYLLGYQWGNSSLRKTNSLQQSRVSCVSLSRGRVLWNPSPCFVCKCAHWCSHYYSLFYAVLSKRPPQKIAMQRSTDCGNPTTMSISTSEFLHLWLRKVFRSGGRNIVMNTIKSFEKW